MGAATEAKSTGQIKEIFGGRVESFQKPPRDVQARGRKPGQVTDAFSIPYMLTNAIVQADGKITREIAMESLLEWGDTEYFEPFAGMTTRKAIIEMNRQKKMNTWDYIGHLGNKLFKGHYYALSSNGAAVKAYPAGLFSNGNVDKAIENAVEIAISSHDDPWSVSGACAIAAAICEAMSMMQLYTTLCRQQNMDAGRAKRLPENGQIFMCIRDHRLQNDWIWQLTLHSILQTIRIRLMSCVTASEADRRLQRRYRQQSVFLSQSAVIA